MDSVEIRRRRNARRQARRRDRAEAAAYRRFTPRNPWFWTWLQPPAVLAVILAGGMAAGDPYPAGEPKETALLVWLMAVTVPGLVAQAVDAVRRSHRTAPGERSEYQRLLQFAKPQPTAPVLPPSAPADAAARIIGWFLAVSVLDLAVVLVLTPWPVDEDWRTLAFLPILLAMCLALVVLLGSVLALAVITIRLAITADPGHPFIPSRSLAAQERVPAVFRALMLAVGIGLLGLGTFGVPYAVLSFGTDVDLPHGIGGLFALGAYAASVDTGALIWLWGLRVTVAMMLGGLAGAVVLSPFAFRRMMLRPAVDADAVPEVDGSTRGRRE